MTPKRSAGMSRRAFLQAGSAPLVSAGSGVWAQPTPASDSASLAVFHSAITLRHEPEGNHPESPARLGAVLAGVRATQARVRLTQPTSRVATDDELRLVHTATYLERVKAEVAARRRVLSTGDTALSAGSLDAARAGVGCVLSAVEAVLKGPTRQAFCAIRPPGHHASPGRGMGFCLFNNVALGVRYAQTAFGVERVLVVDWDVHHGNGTQDVFWHDGSVLFFDTHQHPWYPGTGVRTEVGEGKGRGLIVNRPFPSGAGRREVLTAFREELVPAAERFKPQLVMISAGFDSRVHDPLGQFTLEDADFADMTVVVCDIARQFAAGRVVSVLEGGYALQGLASAVEAHLTSLAQ